MAIKQLDLSSVNLDETRVPVRVVKNRRGLECRVYAYGDRFTVAVYASELDKYVMGVRMSFPSIDAALIEGRGMMQRSRTVADVYADRRNIASKLGSAIANGRTAEVKELLEQGKKIGVRLYGKVGKPTPKEWVFFFNKQGVVVYPSVVYQRPDKSLMVLSPGTAK